MEDKLVLALDKIKETFDQNLSAKMLLSWDHSQEDFVVHDLTYVHNTQNYFNNSMLLPICVVIKSHFQQLADPELLKSIAQNLSFFLSNLSHPPCATPILFFGHAIQAEATE